MTKPVTGLTTFASSAPPWNLTNLDGDIAALQNAINDLGTYSNPLTDTSGAANTITVSSLAGLTASYVLGLLIYVKVANTTTSSTVNVNLNGLGNQAVKLPNGQTPPIGILVASGVYAFFYDGASFQLVGMLPLVASTTGVVSAPDDGGTLQAIGWRGTPQNLQNSNYVLVLADRGKEVQLWGATGQTLTVPANVFSGGDVVTVTAFNSTNNYTIVQGTGLTMYWAGNGITSGNRTLSSVGIATIQFQSATSAVISGAGLS